MADKKKELNTKYYELKREQICQRAREKYPLIKEKKREYYLANRETRTEYAKERYRQKRDVINPLETCECGMTYRRQYMLKHRKTCLDCIAATSIVL